MAAAEERRQNWIAGGVLLKSDRGMAVANDDNNNNALGSAPLALQTRREKDRQWVRVVNSQRVWG